MNSTLKVAAPEIRTLIEKIKADIAKMGKIVQAAGAKLD